MTSIPQTNPPTFRRRRRVAHSADQVTAELMGHTKVDVTLSAYTQTLADAHATAAARIGQALFTIGGWEA